MLVSLSASKVTEEVISNGHCVTANHTHNRKSICNSNSISNSSNSQNSLSSLSSVSSAEIKSLSYSELDSKDSRKHNSSTSVVVDKHDYQYMETQLTKQTNSVNDFDDSDESCEREKQVFKSNGVACFVTTGSSQGRNKWSHSSVKDNLSTSLHSTGNSKRNRNSSKEITANNYNSPKDDHTYRWVTFSCFTNFKIWNQNWIFCHFLIRLWNVILGVKTFISQCFFEILR